MSASVQAMFNAADANHDGVLTQAEFAVATGSQPVVYTTAAAPPVYYTGSSASAPVQYVTAAPPVYVTADMPEAQYYSPPIYSGTGYSASAPVAYSSAPMAYSTAPQYSSPVMYSSPMMYAAPPTDMYAPGARITYQSVTTGQTFPGSVVDMYTDGGCQVVLDVDGGVKDVLFEDMWRVKTEAGLAVPAAVETTPATTTTTTTTKKAKKSKSKKSKKGCC